MGYKGRITIVSESPTFEYLSLADLRFDRANPRFPTSIDGGDLGTVLKFMLQDAGLVDLMRSIAKQGFFPGEPLLVSPGPDGNDKWVVVEGNRRLAACTLLANPELAPTKRQVVERVSEESILGKDAQVPCLKFESRESILEHLGYRHVTGIKEWGPLEKARFLRQQYDSENGDIEERLRSTARSIGSRSDYVGRLLTAHKLYSVLEKNEFFEMEDISESNINFSLISSVLAYKSITNYLGLSGSQDLNADNLNVSRWEFLSRFIFESDDDGNTRLGESRNIRMLADALDSERARRALEERSVTLRQAQQFLGGSGDAFRSLVEQANQNLQEARQEVSETPPDNDSVCIKFGSKDIDSIEKVRIEALELRKFVQEIIDRSE